MSENTVIRYGVIGSGWIADKMIEGAAQYADLQLAAVCSRTAERAAAYAAKHGAPLWFTSAAEMAASDALDMVYIATPNRLHAEQAALFLKNGKHVLCEKPMTAFPQELEQMYHVAWQHDRLLAEAIMLLFQPQLQILRDAVAKLGTISVVHFDFSQLSSKYPAYLNGEMPNIFNPAMETGALQDLGVYCVYPALLLFGEPLDISATASFLRTGADAACTALLRYPDKQVVLTCSKIGQAAAASEIIGDRGSLTIGSVSKLENMVLHMNGEAPQVLFKSEEKATLMGREMHTFAAWIRSGDTKSCARHKELALAVARCMRRIRREAGIRFPRDTAF